jgi:hypothetical protein
MHSDVTRNAGSPRNIVDGNEALPLLNCHWDVSWDAQALLLNLTCQSTMQILPSGCPLFPLAVKGYTRFIQIAQQIWSRIIGSSHVKGYLSNELFNGQDEGAQ